MHPLRAREGLPNRIRSKCRSGPVTEVGGYKPECGTIHGSDPDQERRSAHLMMRGDGTFQDQIRTLPARTNGRSRRGEQIGTILNSGLVVGPSHVVRAGANYTGAKRGGFSVGCIIQT